MTAAANLIGNALFGKARSGVSRVAPVAAAPQASQAALAERGRRGKGDRQGFADTILTGSVLGAATPTQKLGKPANAPGQVGGTTLLGSGASL